MKKEITPITTTYTEAEAKNLHGIDFSTRGKLDRRANNGNNKQFGYLGRPKAQGGRLVELVRRGADNTRIRLDIGNNAAETKKVENHYLFDLFKVKPDSDNGSSSKTMSEDEILKYLTPIGGNQTDDGDQNDEEDPDNVDLND